MFGARLGGPLSNRHVSQALQLRASLSPPALANLLLDRLGSVRHLLPGVSQSGPQLRGRLQDLHPQVARSLVHVRLAVSHSPHQARLDELRRRGSHLGRLDRCRRLQDH